MKSKDIRTIKSLISEYGMNSGVSTPSSQQQTGSTAKATAAEKPQKSSVNKPQNSPSSQQNKTDAEAPAPVEPTVSKAKELAQDFEYQDDKGDTVKVVSPMDNGLNKDAVVVQNQKNKEFFTLDPEDDIAVPGEEPVTEKSDLHKTSRRKHKLKSRIKRLVRAQKYIQQGDPLFEINFNKPDLAKQALGAAVKCGFEAETVWSDLSGNDDNYSDHMDGENWYTVQDYISDQEGHRAVESVEEAFREWIQETDYFYDAERAVIDELVNDRKDEEEWTDKYVEAHVDMDDVSEYKEMILGDLNSKDTREAHDEIAEREDWEEDAWAREYVEVDREDHFIEFLTDEIRDNGEQWDDAWDNVLQNHDPDTWVNDEYNGNWNALLGDLDIYITNESGGGQEEVAQYLDDWANQNSFRKTVEAGEYHSGTAVDNDYWRVEDDSSIDGYGLGSEIISPVYDTPQDMLTEMKSLFNWFSEEQSVETNTSTGLHITMSMAESGSGETNKLKMALLLGDQYLLKQFNRSGNSYTASQQGRIKKYVEDLSKNQKSEKSLEGLEEILSSGISSGKFSSINFKEQNNSEGNKLIEFRVAGGSDYTSDVDLIVKTVIRYAAVMQAGHNKEAYRADYIKALFRMLNSVNEIDPDTEKNASSFIDPSVADVKVIDAFKDIASKKSYKDALEYLGMAYTALGRANDLRSKDKQTELPFEEDFEAETEEETETLDQARQRQKEFTDASKKYFSKAFAMIINDMVQGQNRNDPKVKQIAGFRKAFKDFDIPGPALWDMIKKEKLFTRSNITIHQRETDWAEGFNKLLKINVAKARVADFNVNFATGEDTLFMVDEYLNFIEKEGELDTFGTPDGAVLTDPGDKLKPEMFTVVPEKDLTAVERAVYEYDDAIDDHKSELDMAANMQKELDGEEGDKDSVTGTVGAEIPLGQEIATARSQYGIYDKMLIDGASRYMRPGGMSKLADYLNRPDNSNEAKIKILQAIQYNADVAGGNALEWSEVAGIVTAYNATDQVAQHWDPVEKAREDHTLFNNMMAQDIEKYMQSGQPVNELVTFLNNPNRASTIKDAVLLAITRNKEAGEPPLTYANALNLGLVANGGWQDEQGNTHESVNEDSDTQRSIDTRNEKAAKFLKTAKEKKVEIDAFEKKYNFVPQSTRYGKKGYSVGNMMRVNTGAQNYIASKYNVSFSKLKESNNMFENFNKLPLRKQLEIVSKVDSKKINEALTISNKKLNETIEAEQDMTALLTTYGTPGKKKKKGKGFEHPNKSGSGRAAKYVEGKKDFNFDHEDLYKLQGMDDLSKIKAFALSLISNKHSSRQMKPEKVAWFDAALDRTKSKEGVVKMMWDLLLSGEGHGVKGSRFSTDKNNYRAVMGEGAVPDNSPEKKIRQLLNVPLLASDLRSQMEAYFVVPDPSMIRAFREAAAGAGTDVDLRTIFKGFIQNKVHPDLKKKAGITESKSELIKKLAELPDDEKTTKLVNYIEQLLDDMGVGGKIQSLSSQLGEVPDEDVKKAIKQIAKIIASIEMTPAERAKLFMDWKGDKLIRVDTLLSTSTDTMAEIFVGYGMEGNEHITELVDDLNEVVQYGIGPGEFALSVLSQRIGGMGAGVGADDGKGDLMIDGQPIELKTTRKNSARFNDRQVTVSDSYKSKVTAFFTKYDEKFKELEAQGAVLRVKSGMQQNHVAAFLKLVPEAEKEIAEIISNIFTELPNAGVEIAQYLAQNNVNGAMQSIAQSNVNNYLASKRQGGNLKGILFLDLKKKTFTFIQDVKDLEGSGLRLHSKTNYLVTTNENPFANTAIVDSSN